MPSESPSLECDPPGRRPLSDSTNLGDVARRVDVSERGADAHLALSRTLVHRTNTYNNIDSLPADVFLEIAEHMSGDAESRVSFAIRLSVINRTLRKLALATPSLWTTVHNHQTTEELQAFLTRSNGLGLTIVIGPWGEGAEYRSIEKTTFFHQVTRHAGRWRSLQFDIPMGDGQERMREDTVQYLKALNAGLKTFTGRVVGNVRECGERAIDFVADHLLRDHFLPDSQTADYALSLHSTIVPVPCSINGHVFLTKVVLDIRSEDALDELYDHVLFKNDWAPIILPCLTHLTFRAHTPKRSAPMRTSTCLTAPNLLSLSIDLCTPCETEVGFYLEHLFEYILGFNRYQTVSKLRFFSLAISGRYGQPGKDEIDSVKLPAFWHRMPELVGLTLHIPHMSSIDVLDPQDRRPWESLPSGLRSIRMHGCAFIDNSSAATLLNELRSRSCWSSFDRVAFIKCPNLTNAFVQKIPPTERSQVDFQAWKE